MAVTLPTKGRSVGVYYGDSPEALIAGIRTKSLAVNASPIDDTTDDDAAVRSLLDEPGQLDVSITCSGIIKDQVLIQDALGTSDRVRSMEFRWPGTTRNGFFRGDFFFESFTITGEYQGAATFEASFQSAGTISYQPAQ
jgi:TP901-1 family phage major tail protein